MCATRFFHKPRTTCTLSTMPRQSNRLYKGPRVLVGVRVPKSVHQQLRDAARENHMDVGPYASLLIERAVRASEPVSERGSHE